MRRRAAIGIGVLVTLCAAVLPRAFAAGVVTDCSNDTPFSSLLSSGGSVVFNCGGVDAAATITLSSTKTIGGNTTIDGGGKITLSGGGLRRLFSVNAGTALALSNLTLMQSFDIEGATSRDNGQR